MRTLLIAALLLSTDAMACVVLGPEALRIDTTEADGERPQAPTVAVDINRGGPRLESTGCGTNSTSCDDIAFLTLRMTPDTPDSAYAYVIEVVGGDAPTSFGDGEFAWLASGSDMVFHWSDGATVEQEPLDFTLEISAMNESGSIGEPVVVDVVDAGTPPTPASCSTSGRPLGGLWLVALILTWRRRTEPCRYDRSHRGRHHGHATHGLSPIHRHAVQRLG